MSPSYYTNGNSFSHDNDVRPTILVTGGCGYIGSHTIVCLLQATPAYDVVVVDNLDNSSPVALDRVAQIVGFKEERQRRITFHEVDIRDENALRKVFQMSPQFAGCIHFAGLKAVGESNQIPLEYYSTNIGGSLVLVRLLEEFHCRNFVFSSSCTVYGDALAPVTEASSTGGNVTNPYGRSKHMMEQILTDYQKANPTWSITLLRYFNPVGAHPTGLIGEDPLGIPNCLMPYVSQVAVGRRELLTVFGDDYDTKDGTCIRDYIHVMDLARGHLSAMSYMRNKRNENGGQGAGGLFIFNLGTGRGQSVLEMVKAMEDASGREVKYKIGPRRQGDVPVCYADPALAKKELGWEAELSLDDMCRDLWTWQSSNPNGFND